MTEGVASTRVDAQSAAFFTFDHLISDVTTGKIAIGKPSDIAVADVPFGSIVFAMNLRGSEFPCSEIKTRNRWRITVHDRVAKRVQLSLKYIAIAIATAIATPTE